MQDFLFELGCEELPAGEIDALAEHLKIHVEEALQTLKLGFSSIQIAHTPRRLALILTDLQTETTAKTLEKKGPAKAAAYDANHKPTLALSGFLASCGAVEADLFEVESEKGIWLAVKINQPAVAVKTLLPQILTQAIQSLPIKKSMRWGNNEFDFLRPVHWLVALLGEEIIPLRLFNLTAGRLTYGHRFHHPQAVSIRHPAEYISALRQAYVIVDPLERQQKIGQQVNRLLSPFGLQPKLTRLAEVVNLVEWPVPLLCQFEPEFLSIPAAVLSTTMEVNQRVFPVLDLDNKLQNKFIVIANLESKNPLEVIQGNEKVVRARLRDAQFFYNEDLKVQLVQYNDALKKITFQHGLGTVYDKVERLTKLSQRIAEHLPADEIQNCLALTQKTAKAAGLCKADLCTQMVQEFPELQGYAGHEYALKQGEDPEIAEALEDHYKPRQRGGDLPRHTISIILALADKLDTVVGMFAVGREPSSGSDPYALRRQTLGIISILINKNQSLDLKNIIAYAYDLYHNAGFKLQKEKVVLLKSLQQFFKDRIENWYRDDRPDMAIQVVQAILSRSIFSELPDSRAAEDDYLNPFRIASRVDALADILNTNEGQILKELAKRIANIVKAGPYTLPNAAFFQKEERALWDAYLEAEHALKLDLPMHQRYRVLVQCAKPISNFFEHVMVNDLDPVMQSNRQNMLGHIHALFQSLADFSKL